MTPSRAFPNGSMKNSEVIDLVSSDDENEAPSYSDVVTTGKRSRDDSASSNNNGRASKKGSDKSTNDENDRAAHQSFPSTCMPFINADVPDGAIVTEGLISLLHGLNPQQARVITCSGRSQSTPTRSSLLHIQQPDRWSCGFRNLQMVLTTLLPLLPEHHAFYQSVPASLGHYPDQDNRPVPVPSLFQLQTFLEDSWKEGFDEKGARHYRYNIVGKSSLIGAIEVSTILSYLHLDSTVVQFIKIQESKALLGPFVWNYFAQGPCFTCSANVSTCTLVERLLEAAAASHNNGRDDTTRNDASCSCPLLPLYLQWEGHSVIIVGVEKGKNGVISFITFDPMKSGTKLQDALSSSNKNVPGIMRLSTNVLLRKDCQVIVCSPRQLSDEERTAAKKPTGTVTAAAGAVARYCQRRQY